MDEKKPQPTFHSEIDYAEFMQIKMHTAMSVVNDLYDKVGIINQTKLLKWAADNVADCALFSVKLELSLEPSASTASE